MKLGKLPLLFHEIKNNPRLIITLSAGVLGSYYVFGTIVISPLIGFGLFFTSVIFGELLMSLLIDYYGFFWTTARPVDNSRLLGLLLVFGGVLTFQWETFTVEEEFNIMASIFSIVGSILCGIMLIIQSSFNQRVALVLESNLGSTLLSIFEAVVITLIASINALIKHSLEIQVDNVWDHL
jgi:uncharacterized membrane protein YdcZ (DUF606 family)